MPIQTSSLFEIMAALPAGSTLLLHEVNWTEYEALLPLLPDYSRFRLSYDHGTLEIMTLSPVTNVSSRFLLTCSPCWQRNST
jgi:hypothetical protein